MIKVIVKHHQFHYLPTVLLISCLTLSFNKASADEGEKIFRQYCATCHARGMEHPGTMNLAKKFGKETAALEDRNGLPADYVRYLVRNGRGLMPAFRPTEINKKELDALASYLANGPHPAKQIPTDKKVSE